MLTGPPSTSPWSAEPDGETRYRQLFENMAAGFALHEIILDADGRPFDYRYLEVNPAFERLTGLSASALVGRTLLEVLPQTEARWIAFFGRVALTGEPAETEDYSRELDRWHEVRAFSPAKGRFAVVFTEVTQRKRMEAELRAREEDLQITLRSLAEGVIATGPDGRITRINPAAEALTGWRAADAMGRPLAEVLVIEAAAEGGMRDITTLVGLQGRRRRVSLRSAPRRGDDGRECGKVLVLHDLTEQLLQEEQRRQNQKMDALGQLAGGIAHDLNNMLGGILGSSEMLLRRRNLDDGAVRYLRLIGTTTERAAALIGRLLAFARHQPREAAPVDVHALIQDAVLLLGSSLDRRITVQADLAAACSRVLGDGAQLQSAILNLAINGAHAMPEGGTLTFRTTVVQPSPAQCGDPIFPLQPGSYLAIAVSDTGHGIPPEVLPRIFEPFFTTKGVGQGTGLGLAAVFGTVRQHHGRIEVASNPTGSTFRLLLPLTDQVEAASNVSEMPMGRGLILVVDDEVTLQGLAQEMLESLGYHVACVGDGKAALEFVIQHGEAVALVFLDMVMPVMGGPACFEALRAVRPRLPVVLATGYMDAGLLEPMLAAGLCSVVSKPYRMTEVASAMAAALLKSGLIDETHAGRQAP
jgi:PAS domain S-box-containing protein